MLLHSPIFPVYGYSSSLAIPFCFDIWKADRIVPWQLCEQSIICCHDRRVSLPYFNAKYPYIAPKANHENEPKHLEFQLAKIYFILTLNINPYFSIYNSSSEHIAPEFLTGATTPLVFQSISLISASNLI